MVCTGSQAERNAVAEFCGSSARRVGVVEDILRARSGEISQAREVHLLDCEGKLAPFAGLGVDAAVLNDYVRLKDGLAGKKLQFAAAGGLGYFLSIVGRTIPGYALQRGVPQESAAGELLIRHDTVEPARAPVVQVAVA